MSLDDLPNELLEVIAVNCYEEKIASLANLSEIHSANVVSFARRTAIYCLSMTSKRIRNICMPLLFRKLFIKQDAVEALSSGKLKLQVELNNPSLHLVK